MGTKNNLATYNARRNFISGIGDFNAKYFIMFYPFILLLPIIFYAEADKKIFDTTFGRTENRAEPTQLR